MVGGRKFFSETQGPENPQNRIQARQQPSFVIYVTTPQPVSNASQRLAQERKSQLRAIQGRSTSGGW